MLKIINECGLNNFDFWNGAKDRAAKLTEQDFDLIECELKMLYPEGLTDTQLNDLFWFDFDFIVQILGYDDEEAFDKELDKIYCK